MLFPFRSSFLPFSYSSFRSFTLLPINLLSSSNQASRLLFQHHSVYYYPSLASKFVSTFIQVNNMQESKLSFDLSKFSLNDCNKDSIPSLPSVSGADPKACPLDVFRLYIVQHLHAHTSDLTADYLYSVIEETKKFISADLSVPVQKLKLKGNPVDIAKKISEK
ncbi:hypothetical protein HMI55_000821, partial [Coelomomyces lativittatus]